MAARMQDMFRENAAGDLLDQVKEAKGLRSDYALAKFLGITTQGLTNIRRNGGMSTTTIVQCAEALNQNPMKVIAKVEVSRAKSDREVKVWKKYAGRATPDFLLALGGISLIAVHPVAGVVVSSALVAVSIMRSPTPCSRLGIGLTASSHLPPRLRSGLSEAKVLGN